MHIFDEYSKDETVEIRVAANLLRPSIDFASKKSTLKQNFNEQINPSNANP